MKKVFKTMAFTLLGLVLSMNLWGAANATYTQVTDAASLKAGDVIALGCAAKEKAAGAMGTGVFLTSVDATIKDGKMTSVNAIEITLGGSAGAWTLTTSEGQITTSKAKELKLNDGTQKTWTISFEDGAATITGGSYGKIQYNAGSPRFLNYTSSQTAIEIYKKDAADPDAKDVSIDADDELNLTAEESDGTITVTYGDDVADKEVNLFSDASCTTPFTGDWFTADFDASGNVEYMASANTGAAREAYIQIYVIADDAKTDNTKVIKVTQEEYKEPTGTFVKFTGDITEGDYVIVSTNALSNTVNSNRIASQSVTISNDKIVNPDEAIIWHIAASGDYWTLYNAAVEKYAASTSSKNQATMAAGDLTDNMKWTITGSATYEFENLARSTGSNSDNKWLRYNSGNAENSRWACYGTSTGSALTLYKKSNGLETVATPTFSPAAGLYEAEQDITISCTTNGASIYYTTDGTAPTTSSTPYTGTFKLKENKTIKAIAVKEGMNNSSVASATYTFALPYTSLAEFVSAAPESESALVLDADDGVVIIGATAKNLYVQDAAGTTMILYNNSAAPSWAAGKRIEGKLTGTYATYQGMNEMVLISWNNANADNDGTMPEPAVLTELTESTFATYFGKYIKMEGQYFQSTGLSSNAVDTKNAGQTITSKMYNTFGVMTGKTLPANDDATVVEGVFIKYNSDYELAVTSIAAGDAKIDVDPVGGADAVNAVALAMNAQVTVTPVAGFATKLNNNPITEATTVTINEAKSITVVSNRDFYTEKSVTYFYKVDESAKAVTVNQPEVGGTIAANPVSGVAGDIITLTYEAAAHYNFGSFSVMAGETPVTVSENAGVYTFEMPNANVTVSATFNIMNQYTATFVAGAQTATGSVNPIARYMDELEFQLPANGFSYAGHVFAGWSDGSTVKQPGDNYTLAGDKEFTATWEELPIWAYTYTSNVTLSTTGGTNAYKEAVKIRVDDELTQFDALRGAKSSGTGVVKVTVPAHTSALHFHMAGWKDVSGDVTIKKGEESLQVITLIADAGITGSSPYTLSSADPAADYYYNMHIADSETATELTFNSGNGKRFVLFGVNAILPAEITLDEANEYDFGEVKENASANKIMIFTVNDFADVDNLAVSFTGEDADMFSAGDITATENDNEYQVEVTFTPGEIQESIDATLEITDGEAIASQALTGKGIAATTPEIAVSVDEIDFGKVKQDASVAAQQVTVTLSYLETATASISEGAFTIDKTDLVLGENTITISATASSMGAKNATITITGEGATTKTIAVKMDVTSKWAGEYTSNVKVGSDKVIISEEEYEAHKAGGSKTVGSTTITVPEGAYALHFHAAGWNNEDVTLAVKNGDTELGSFNLYKDAGVSGSGPSYTLQGNNYDTEQYFHVEFDALEEETTFTFAATSGNRFVLYGVNQEGGLTKELSAIEVSGTPNKLQYTEGAEFDPTGLTVMGTFKFGEETLPDKEDVTDQVTEWVVDPVTLASTTTSVSVVAKVGEIASEAYTVENIRVLPENTDMINASTGTATTTTYKEFTATGLTNTQYAGKTALNNGNLTLSNAASHPGIVSTFTIGYIKSVKVTIVDDNTRNLDVYGSHRAYQSAEDLYSLKNAIRGTKIGTLTASGVLDLSEAETKYEFIGIRSEEGAIQVPEIQITWTPVEFLRISVAENIEGGTIDIDRTVATAEEAGIVQVTIEPTPNEGRLFDKLVIYNESDVDVTASITIAESGLAFTMPNYNVKVGAIFKSQPVTAISLDKTSITIDKNNTETLTASFLPQGAFTDVTWTSANETIATVENGVVTGMGQGTTTITASCNDGALTATCSVTVNAQPEYELVTNAADLQDGDVIVLGNAAKSAANGGYNTSKYLDKVEATITEGVLTATDLMEITLCKTDAGWNLVTEQGHLGATTEKKLLINDVYTDWTISISENSATISAGDPGRFLYNVNSPRFLNYTSNTSTTMLLPEIYRLSSDTKKVVKLMDKNNVYAIYRVHEGENVTLSVALPSGCTKGWTIDGKTYAKNATIENVTADMVLYAIQSEEVISENNKEISSKDVNKGSTITIGDGETETNVTISSDGGQEKAQAYQIVVKKNATVTISTPSDISNLEVEVGGKVTVGTTKKLTVNNFVIKSTMAGGESGQVLGVTEEYFEITGEAYYDVVMDKCVEGKNIADQWHAFAVPFNVDAINGVYDENDNKLTNEVNYAIMDYHGDVRAQGQYGWKKFRGIMQPGVFYLMTVDGARTTYRMKMNGGFQVASKEITVNKYESSEDTDAGWNGIANNQLGYSSLGVNVQVLNPTWYTYETMTASEYNFTVGTPFFYQANGEEEDGKITLAAANSENPAYAPRMTAEAKNIAVTLGNDNYTDRLYISATDEATNEYQIGRDLVKMTMTNTPTVPQIFAEAYGTKLSMIDVPMMYDEAVYALNLYAPANGEYTMGAAQVEGYEVFLTQYGSVIWNLSMSEATVELTKGNNTEYGLILKTTSGHAPTDINTLNGQESVQKFLYNSNIYIIRENQKYNAQGIKIQ